MFILFTYENELTQLIFNLSRLLLLSEATGPHLHTPKVCFSACVCAVYPYEAVDHETQDQSQGFEGL